MKRLIRIAFFVLLLAPATLAKAQNEFGIGLIVGEPTGISMKQWISDQHAIDAAIAWSFSHDTTIQVHADYLFHRVRPIRADEYRGQLPFYFGIGGRAIFNDDPLIGVRFPVGIGRTMREAPIEFFFELVPILDLAPDTKFDINAAVGARFYLGQ